MLLYLLQTLREVDFLLRVGYKKNTRENRLLDAWTELKELMEEYISSGVIEECDHSQARDVFRRGNKTTLDKDKSYPYEDFYIHPDGVPWKVDSGLWFIKIDGEKIKISKKNYEKYGIKDLE